MKIISLGWGVQSFTMAVMSALGDLEKVDVAIHADTGYEACWTYRFSYLWKDWLEQHGIVVVLVEGSHEKMNVCDKWGGVQVPAYMSDGIDTGQIRRQCTHEWKIKPMRQWLQKNRNREPVEQWIGISLDEAQRMKESDVKYITNRYPLIENRMTRNDCINYLNDHKIEVPGRSSCYFCPYHSRHEWREIKRSSNGDWEKAVAIDEQIRKARPPYDLFVCVQRKPLPECDFDSLEDKGQYRLWDEECSGICGV